MDEASRFPVPVVQYNVLSSKYCTSDMYKKCPPMACTPEYRIKKLQGQLIAFVNANAIICLQEVCYTFRGQLETFFAERGYRLVCTNYNAPWSGCMGTAIAYPEMFLTVRCQFSRIADVYESLVPEKIVPAKRTSFIQNILWALYLSSDPYLSDVEAITQNSLAKFDSEMRKTNAVQILLELRTPDNSKGSFVVSTYHAPCRFWDDNLMLMLTALPLHVLSTFCSKDTSAPLPCILAGDFNTLPSSDTYTLYTSGRDKIPNWNRYNAIIQEVVPTLCLPVMNSASFEHSGEEPSNTTQCYTVTKGKPKEFIATLDYIFVSDSIGVTSFEVFPDPAHQAQREYLPNSDHPSDHRILFSELML